VTPVAALRRNARVGVPERHPQKASPSASASSTRILRAEVYGQTVKTPPPVANFATLGYIRSVRQRYVARR